MRHSTLWGSLETEEHEHQLLSVVASLKSMLMKACLILVLLWTTPSVCLILWASVAMLREPDWPFGLGFIQTTGPNGLWVTVPLGLCGLLGLVLLFRRRKLGAGLLLVYCLFWVVTLFGGFLKDWHVVQTEGPLNASIVNDLYATLIIAGIILGFTLVGLWSWHEAKGRVS